MIDSIIAQLASLSIPVPVTLACACVCGYMLAKIPRNVANQESAGADPLGQSHHDHRRLSDERRTDRLICKLTTEVENYPGFPAGNLESYLNDSIEESKRKYMAPHTGHGVSGPELMELMRQQAKNFGTKVVTDDVVDIDFSGTY